MRPQNKWCVLAVVSSALFLITIDMTVLYTALPRLTHDLAATAAQKLWIVNAYALVVAGLLPGLGTLGDRAGHKRMLMAGLVVFGAASLFAAFASSAAQLILARVVLGAGAAMMMPATLSIIRITFKDARERALALGIWGAISAGGAALGPVVGGVILEYHTWGAVFLINLPVVLAAIAAGARILPADLPGKKAPWSPGASLLIMAGLIGVTFAVKEISRPGASGVTAAASLVLGLAALTAFVRGQRRSAHPLIDFSLFGDRTFSLGVLAAMTASVVMIGVELAISQRLQLVGGLSPLQAAFAILPIPLASFVGGPVAGLLLARLGTQKLLTGAFLLAGFGLGILALHGGAGGMASVAGMASMGFGMGAAMSAASTSIMSRASTRNAGMAASIEEVSFELGGAMGIAVFGSILSAVYSTSLVLPHELAQVTSAYDSLDAALLAAESMAPDAADALIGIAQDSFDKAFTVVLMVGTAILGVMAAALAITNIRKVSQSV